MGRSLEGADSFIGTCGLDDCYFPEHARAEVGYALSRERWGRGIMPEALRAMIHFGFKQLDLNRIESRCIAENTASARVMEKADMVYEGTLRERELIKGSYRDTKIYAILRADYQGRVPSGQPPFGYVIESNASARVIGV